MVTRRYVILFAFSLLTCSNSWSWITWSPIKDEVKEYWNVKDAWIDQLSTLFMVRCDNERNVTNLLHTTKTSGFLCRVSCTSFVFDSQVQTEVGTRGWKLFEYAWMCNSCVRKRLYRIGTSGIRIRISRCRCL